MSPISTIASIFAEATWTDKEVLTTIISIVLGLLGVLGLILKFATAWSRARARKMEAERDKLQKEIDSALRVVGASDLRHVQQQVGQLRRDTDECRAAAEENKAVAEQAQTDLDTESRRIQKALSKDGQTWTERVLANAPELKPLAPDGRRTPVISVLNLKGGVGKTTITANLATALDAVGYRVLLFDLDLQGSLTDIFLPDHEQDRLVKENRLLADFLGDSFGSEYPNLHVDYTYPVLADQKSRLVPAGDNLAYAETNLTIRWLLREGNRDPRFLLRKELQLKRITSNYDVVLMDCSPIINVCCVNALAASDYILIPVLPSKQATSRVPVLLRRLKEFREIINPDLKLLGIVANRTQRTELTHDEKNRLDDLHVECRDVWGTDVPMLDTFIRQSGEVRTAEDERRPLLPGEDTFCLFKHLAKETVSLLPSYCAAPAAKEVEA
jgi:cellulose biosynthesis protein BcsQ